MATSTTTKLRCPSCRNEKAALVKTSDGRKICSACMHICNFCRENKPLVTETRDGRRICESCKGYHRYCNICGSLPVNDDVKNQAHFEEDCP